MKRFDIYWVDLDPAMGHEIKKTRPGIIVSPDELNRHLATVLVAPVTSVIREYPFRVTITVGDRKSQVALDQIRALDKKRLEDRIESLDLQEQELLQCVLHELFA